MLSASSWLLQKQCRSFVRTTTSSFHTMLLRRFPPTCTPLPAPLLLLGSLHATLPAASTATAAAAIVPYPGRLQERGVVVRRQTTSASPRSSYKLNGTEDEPPLVESQKKRKRRIAAEKLKKEVEEGHPFIEQALAVPVPSHLEPYLEDITDYIVNHWLRLFVDGARLNRLRRDIAFRMPGNSPGKLDDGELLSILGHIMRQHRNNNTNTTTTNNNNNNNETDDNETDDKETNEDHEPKEDHDDVAPPLITVRPKNKGDGTWGAIVQGPPRPPKEPKTFAAKKKPTKKPKKKPKKRHWHR